jgi:hypothetical protein
VQLALQHKRRSDARAAAAVFAASAFSLAISASTSPSSLAGVMASEASLQISAPAVVFAARQSNPDSSRIASFAPVIGASLRRRSG